MGIQYNEVCGRVIGYQYSSTDGFHIPDGFVDDIDNTYVEGVSITHGSPRHHIWTLASSLYDTVTSDAHQLCPYVEGSTQKTQSFVCEDYYCEYACTESLDDCEDSRVLYTGDRLWDGRQCGPAEKGGCSSTQPWFHKVLDCIISDDIELRICSNANTDNEDVPLELYEIFIK